MDLEENLMEVVCCFSLAPVGAADLRKQSIKRRESRRGGSAATSGADLDSNANASGGAGRHVSLAGAAAAWLTADQTLNFATKKRRGGGLHQRGTTASRTNTAG